MNCHRQSRVPRQLLPWAAWAIVVASAVRADTLVYRAEDGHRTVEGKLVRQTAAELLFLVRDGRMVHLDDLSRLVELRRTDQPLRPVDREEMSRLLLAEFGRGFRLHKTTHYLICYNSDARFAISCGRLLENLHRAFTNYFRVRRFELAEPQFPLVAVVFGTQGQFHAYAEKELGERMSSNVIGFYSFLTNRVAMYNMRAGLELQGLGNVLGPARKARRDVLDTAVATVIHEATHQLAYNTGFHRRFSDNPLWLAEGMAMYFEAPDRRAGTWRGIGAVNRLRMPLFRQHYLHGNERFDIASLVADDERLRDGRTARLAYAQAWALTYYLLKRRRQQFYAYLRILSEKPPLGSDSPEQRLADFRAAFGSDLNKLAFQCLSYMRTVR